MIELAFVACLVTAPTQCDERQLVFAEPISQMQCLMGAQVELARWNEAHPNLRVAKWSCRQLDPNIREARI